MATQIGDAERRRLRPPPAEPPCARLVAKLSAVADLSADDEQLLHDICRGARKVAAQRAIIREGDKPDHVHVIVDGWAARVKDLANGSRQITAFLLPGDFCDLHVTILGEMDHNIVALTDVTVAYVPHKEMEELPRHRPELGRALWWATLVDEAVLRAWIVNVGRRDSYRRLAHLFCELHARLKLIGLATEDSFQLPITQETIGEAQGLTPVHVNRTLQALRRDGLIELSGRVMTIPNVPALRRAADFDPNYLHRGRLARR